MEDKNEPESKVRVACIQMEPRIGENDQNLATSLNKINDAGSSGARLVVLPELCNSGYIFKTRDEANSLAERIPDGPSCQGWADMAARYNMYIVAGIAESDGFALYNSAVVIGPEGVIGTYRKNHLWGEENLFFEPGNLGVPVFHTAIGRIAVVVCYDVWFPETFRLSALQGADILCVPTNWVPMPDQPKHLPKMANILSMSGAHSNSMFVAAANRVGVERGQSFIGNSLIVSYTGWPIAGPATEDKEEILFADINLSDARRRRNWNDFNQVLRDRRTDLYDEHLGADIPDSWY